MTRSFRVAALSFVVSLVLAGSPVAAGAGEKDCITANRILHCPLGAAGLVPDGDGVLAAPLLDPASDGVVSFAAAAESWTAVLKPAAASELRLSAVSSKQPWGYDVVSTSRFVASEKSVELSATFVTPTYRVEVLRGGTVVAALGGISSGTSGVQALRGGGGNDVLDGGGSDFRAERVQGGKAVVCLWAYSFEAAAKLLLADGRIVEATGVRLVEELPHEPYGVDQIRLTGRMDALLVHGESFGQ